MKRISRILALAVLTMVLAMSTALAEPSAKELAQLQKKVDQANRKIESMIEHAQRTPKDDVDKLLEQVSRTVDSVMRYADQIGATVVCEYETYFIDGRYVEIEPLRVVNV